MERLLTDGGDLDSMDRSLLDYNGVNSKPVNGTVTSPMSDLNVSLLGNGNGSANGGMNGSTTNGNGVTPTATPTLTSPTSYKSSENGPPAPAALSPTAVTTQMMNKRDIVVRFTEDRNSVQNVKMTLSATSPANAHASQQQHNSSSSASASKSAHQMPPPEAYRCVEDLLDQTDCGRGRRTIARICIFLSLSLRVQRKTLRDECVICSDKSIGSVASYC